MTTPHSLPAFDCAPLTLRVLCSHPPSAHVLPPAEPIRLSLTVFGDDPDEAVTSHKLVGTSFLGMVSGWLCKQGECLGVVVNLDDEGEVEWNIHKDEAGNDRLGERHRVTSRILPLSYWG